MAFALFERSPSSGLGNIRRSYGEPSRNIDWVLMVAVAVQTTIGAVIVYSATRPRLLNRGADPFYFLQRQIIFIIFAAAILAFIMLLDYGGQLRGNAGLLYVGTIILLVLVLVAGAATGGARLSFNLGPVSLQPSEFAKVATLLLLAGFLADDDSDSVSYERFIQGLMLVGLPAALITVEPDLGSASVLVACAMGVMLVAGARMRNIVFVTSLAIVSVTGAVAAGVVSNYQLRRITAFFNQNSDETRLQSIVYQVRFAKRAVANGGLFGKGYLKGPLTNPRGDFVASFSDCPNGKRSFRPISVCRRLHDDSVAIFSKYWDDNGTYARNGGSAAICQLWRFSHGGLCDHGRNRPERAYAPFSVAISGKLHPQDK